jgi:hypothetical protein
MKRSLLATAVAVLLMLPAYADNPVHFKAGQSVTFRNPYKTGCATVEAANKVMQMARDGVAKNGMTVAEVQSCYGLIADKSYNIAEVQQYGGVDFYRITLGTGDQVWTYILGSRDVKESVGVGMRLVMHTPSYACANIDTIVRVTSIPDPVAKANFVAGHRGLVNDVCDNLPVGVELQVQNVMMTSNNFYRFACVAKYESNVAADPSRPCVWTLME